MLHLPDEDGAQTKRNLWENGPPFRVQPGSSLAASWPLRRLLPRQGRRLVRKANSQPKAEARGPVCSPSCQTFGVHWFPWVVGAIPTLGELQACTIHTGRMTACSRISAAVRSWPELFCSWKPFSSFRKRMLLVTHMYARVAQGVRAPTENE